MKSVKAKSSKWINELYYLQHRFEWQDGFGAFIYSKGQIDRVYKYIKNQESHHIKITFLKEHEMMVNKYKIDYEDRYIFNEPQ